MSLKQHLDLKTFVFAFFMMAGAFKNDYRFAWVPVDLSLLLGVITLFFCAKAFVDRRFQLPDRVHWITGLFFLLALPLFWTDLAPEYPADKVDKLFTFTMLSALVPFFLFEGRDDVRRFLNALVLLGLIMIIEASSRLGSGPMLRLYAFDASTIAFGRAAGVVLIWSAVQALERRLPTLVAMPLLCWSAIMMLFSGSRGPFLSALGIVAFIGFAFYRTRLREGLTFGVAVLLLGTTLYFGAAYAPGGSVARIENFLQGDLGGSEMTRVHYAAEAVETLRNHPLGLGWGGFAVYLGNGGGTHREYPHNFLLETVVEGGWAAGLALLVVCLVAGRRIARLSSTDEARVALGALLFTIFNACVSGDLNDNKLLFCLLGLCLAYDPGAGQPEEPAATELAGARAA